MESTACRKMWGELVWEWWWERGRGLIPRKYSVLVNGGGEEGGKELGECGEDYKHKTGLNKKINK